MWPADIGANDRWRVGGCGRLSPPYFIFGSYLAIDGWMMPLTCLHAQTGAWLATLPDVALFLIKMIYLTSCGKQKALVLPRHAHSLSLSLTHTHSLAHAHTHINTLTQGSQFILECELVVVMMLEWAGLSGCGLAMRAQK